MVTGFEPEILYNVSLFVFQLNVLTTKIFMVRSTVIIELSINKLFHHIFFFFLDPNHLDVSKSVTSLINTLRQRDLESNWQEILQPVFSHVTLILGTRSRLQNRDLDAFRTVQKNLLTAYPGNYKVYILYYNVISFNMFPIPLFLLGKQIFCNKGIY